MVAKGDDPVSFLGKRSILVRGKLVVRFSLGRISPHTRKNIKKNPETKKVASENRLGWAPRGKDHLETIDVQDQRWKG